MNAAFWGAFAASLGVPLVMAAFRRLYPSGPLHCASFHLDDVAGYRTWDVLELLLAIPYMAVTGWLGLVLLRMVEPLWLPSLVDAHFAYLPEAMAWVCVLMPFTLSHTLLAVIWLARWKWKSKFPEYLAYSNQTHKVDWLKVCRLLSLAFLAMSIGLGTLLGDQYFVLYEDRVMFSPFLSLKQQAESYDEIREILHAPKIRAPAGKIVERETYVFVFRDGSRFSTDQLPMGAGELSGSAIELGRFVASRSLVPITERELLVSSEL